MKSGTFLLGLLLTQIYRIAYLEQRGGEQRKMLARVQGEQVFIDQQVGNFSQNWFLRGLPPRQEVTVIQLEGLPPLALRRSFAEPQRIPHHEKNYLLYPVTYEMNAKQELIPLSEEETRLNEQLKPFGIESIQLKGEGRVMVLENQNEVLFEEFVLRGEFSDQEGSKPWQIEFARGGVW